MYNSSEKILNNSNTLDENNEINEDHVKRNRRNINKENNISTDNSRTDPTKKTKQIINECRRISKDNLPFFHTCKYSLEFDLDFDSTPPLTQYFLNNLPLHTSIHSLSNKLKNTNSEVNLT